LRPTIRANTMPIKNELGQLKIFQALSKNTMII